MTPGQRRRLAFDAAAQAERSYSCTNSSTVASQRQTVRSVSCTGSHRADRRSPFPVTARNLSVNSLVLSVSYRAACHAINLTSMMAVLFDLVFVAFAHHLSDVAAGADPNLLSYCGTTSYSWFCYRLPNRPGPSPICINLLSRMVYMGRVQVRS